jgi:hypothetical protein
MSHFVEHAPCPKCGSRDNLAKYSDGGAYCFGCGFLIPSNTSGWVTQAKIEVEDREDKVYLPSDASQEYSTQAMDWVTKYGITASVLLQRDVYWSYGKERLYFTFWDKSTDQYPELLGYNARTFGAHEKDRKKYITRVKGDLATLLPIYFTKQSMKPQDRSDRLVIVEDCLSAIKIANICTDAMPCLGSDIPLQKVARVASMYHNIIIWLDGNMYKKGYELTERFKYLGCETKQVYTEKDPKEFRYQDLSSLTKM